MSTPVFEIGAPDRDVFLKAGKTYFKLSTSGALTAVSGSGASIDGALVASGLPVSALTATWTTPAYSAGDYTGGGTLVATVASGDVVTNSYLVIGKLMFWRLELTPFSVSGTGTQVRVAIPGGFVASGTTGGAYHFVDNGTGGVGLWEVSSTGTTANFFLTATGSNWAASTDGSAIRATLVFGIA